ncbi:TPA: CRISPR-associated protein Cas4 [Candidatus Bipolaricaulota bacterium]|nr:CRISPR-associated protein Cas4 [Candidatus Bipolaricaulota bacterium]
MDELPLHTGTQVNYYAVCRRKLWLYSHRLELERTSDRVALGALLHETSYQRLPRREMLIDSLIKVDILEGEGKVLEVKYSQKMAEAARLQVLYYLYYLKRKGLTGLVGELRFPRQRRREEVHLTEEGEREVEEALRGIERVTELPAPPEAERTPVCRRCAYAEFCWV